MRHLPDSDLSLRDALDYIFESDLCQRALMDPHPQDLHLVLRDVTRLIHRLTASCHLAEFTDHGLPHLCSLLERISSWTTLDRQGKSELLIAKLEPAACATLLLSILFHDIGMLSQRPDDLPPPVPTKWIKALNDVPDWVRRTHIPRMGGVIDRGLKHRKGTAPSHALLQRAIKVATAHGAWPWQDAFTKLTTEDQAIAAILAVADLLDEDANRCDIITLLSHRQGSPLNRAHWLRHGLTKGRVRVSGDLIEVNLVSLPGADPVALGSVFSALRNHFRLASLYQPALAVLGIKKLEPLFSDAGVPSKINSDLSDWNLSPSFSTSSALAYQLLHTFLPEALLDNETADAYTFSQVSLTLEAVDLTHFREIRGIQEPRSAFEHTDRALAS